jgi:ribosome-associated toxin RatA of RatAB toxin-antitoxin module
MIVRRSALVARPAAQLFDLIEAAEHYPRFLPWCVGAEILGRDEQMVAAELQVQWAGLRFRMRTRNPKRRPEYLAIQLVNGPFRRFDGEWRLHALDSDACKVAFALDVEFDHGLLTAAATPLVNRMANDLVDAFVRRAEQDTAD